MAPIARDGTEYEFTLVWDLDLAHQATASKDRTRLFDGKIQMLTEADGKALAEWLTTDDPQPTVEVGPPADARPWRTLPRSAPNATLPVEAGPRAEPPPPEPDTPPPPDEIPVPLGSEAKVGAVSTLLPPWFTAHELEVNDYLVRVNWIAAGQTWRDLTAERCVSIVGRKDRFARAAGIPPIGGAA
jgi:hypothetical protein